MDCKSLIIIPYAYGGNTGVSIQNLNMQLDTYMKNVCVAAASAVRNADSSVDVMVVSNIQLPNPYYSLLRDFGVKYEFCSFDKFNFGERNADGTVVNWQLAFFKLCALGHCLSHFDYSHICFMDTDVFVQRSFDAIWSEAEKNIMLYDICEPMGGYMIKEMQEFLQTDAYLTHFGGEFFAASYELARMFITECENIFNEMKSVGFMTKSGDEFITSIAAYRLRQKVKNAGAYIRRYWTGSYRMVCDDYKHGNISILHMPAEKEQGIITVYNRYIVKGKIPSKNRVWRLCHLSKPSMRVRIGVIARKLGLVK